MTAVCTWREFAASSFHDRLRKKSIKAEYGPDDEGGRPDDLAIHTAHPHWEDLDEQTSRLEVLDGAGGKSRFYISHYSDGAPVRTDDDVAQPFITSPTGVLGATSLMLLGEAIAWCEDRAGNPERVRAEIKKQRGE